MKTVSHSEVLYSLVGHMSYYCEELFSTQHAGHTTMNIRVMVGRTHEDIANSPAVIIPHWSSTDSQTYLELWLTRCYVNLLLCDASIWDQGLDLTMKQKAEIKKWNQTIPYNIKCQNQCIVSTSLWWRRCWKMGMDLGCKWS